MTKNELEVEARANIAEALALLGMSDVRITLAWSRRMCRTAGLAYPSRQHIKLSETIFQRISAEERRKTTIHEVCHIVVPFRGGGSSHGRLWQRLMRECGLRPDRCHTYDTNNLPNKRKTYPAYCACTGTRVHTLQKCQVKRIVTKATKYRCRSCDEVVVLPKAINPSPFKKSIDK